MVAFIIATAIWIVVKDQVDDTTLPPGGAGGGTGFYKVRVIKSPALFATHSSLPFGDDTSV